MSGTILTLFGEEAAPEQVKAPAKTRLAPPKEKTDQQSEPVKLPAKTEAEIPVIEDEATAVLKDWKPEKKYYSIGEVAALFHVRTSHIRFWTNEFNMKVRTTRKGDRLYSPEQVLQLRTIYHLLKEKRFTIKGAKAKLKEARKPSLNNTDIRQSLMQLRNSLVAIRDSLS